MDDGQRLEIETATPVLADVSDRLQREPGMVLQLEPRDGGGRATSLRR